MTGGLAATEPNTVLLPKYFKWLLVLMKRLSKVQSDKTVRRDNTTKQNSFLCYLHTTHNTCVWRLNLMKAVKMLREHEYLCSPEWRKVLLLWKLTKSLWKIYRSHFWCKKASPDFIFVTVKVLFFYFWLESNNNTEQCGHISVVVFTFIDSAFLHRKVEVV